MGLDETKTISCYCPFKALCAAPAQKQTQNTQNPHHREWQAKRERQILQKNYNFMTCGEIYEH